MNNVFITSTAMKENNGYLHLQIGVYGKRFIPEKYGRVGVLYGEKETTGRGDVVRWYTPCSSVSVIEYEHQGKYHKLYYRRGKWKLSRAKNPIFVVWDLLE